jgi:S-adenosylmethionine:tRNA ribosyltransferase-isomerase
MSDLKLLSSYQYNLPEELIASKPLERRDSSRLLVVNRSEGTICHQQFSDLTGYVDYGDQLVFNNSKVIKARLKGKKATGASIEIMLHKELSDGLWECLVRPGRKMPVGARVIIGEGFEAEIAHVNADGSRYIRFECVRPFTEMLEGYGEMPLPHYMNRSAETLDNARYQTVYAKNAGSVAAPTAGLHFTEEMLEKLKTRGVDLQYVTLHVGWGTFKPVQVENIIDHNMHSETYAVSAETAAGLNSCKGKRIAVGSTSCRTLESAFHDGFEEKSGDTNLFITPGFKFKAVDAMLTNFHLPGSTLLMLISAFGGYELIREAYAQAVAEKYRFFSYGDAMLIT